MIITYYVICQMYLYQMFISYRCANVDVFIRIMKLMTTQWDNILFYKHFINQVNCYKKSQKC